MGAVEDGEPKLAPLKGTEELWQGWTVKENVLPLSRGKETGLFSTHIATTPLPIPTNHMAMHGSVKKFLSTISS